MYKPTQTTLLTCLMALLPALSNAAPCTTPSTQYTDNGDGSITDGITGLIWKRCSEGQTWTGASCDGTSGVYSWANALKLAQSTNASGFLGKTDWRVPNSKELASIADEQCSDPAINAVAFPKTAQAKFWSSSPAAINSKFAWYVDFQNGQISSNIKTGLYYVRLVR